MDLLICHHCGNLIRDKDKFCSECGSKVSAVAATASSRAPITLEPLKAMAGLRLAADGTPAASTAAGVAAEVEAKTIQHAPGPAHPVAQAAQRQSDFFDDAPTLSPAVSLAAVLDTVAPASAEPPAVKVVQAAIQAAQAVEVAPKPAPQVLPEVVQATENFAPPVEFDAAPTAVAEKRASTPLKAVSEALPAAGKKRAGKVPAKIPSKGIIVAAVALVALIAAVLIGPALLAGSSNEGIWLVKYVQFGLPERTFYVQLERQGSKLIGAPVVQGGDGLTGFYGNGQVLLKQQPRFSLLNPYQFAGNGDLSAGSFGGKIIHGGQGKWAAHRMSWFELMFQPPSSDWLRDQFGKVFFGLLLFSSALVFASLKLFGPNGYINIKSRKQYVPSRYKTEHSRMLSQYGKPPAPGSVPLGTRVDWVPWSMTPRKLSLPPEIRRKDPHIVIVGGTGKGKTRLMAGMAAHDIECGDRAVVIVDPDGALSDLVIRHIAAHPDLGRISKRLRIIDGTREQPLSFDPIKHPDNGQLQNMASSVVAGFRAIYTPAPGQQQTWSQQTAHILRSAVLLLCVNGRSLADLPTLLTDNDERDLLLHKVDARKTESAELLMIAESWARYRKLARSEHWLDWVEPILNRVQPVLGDPKLNAIIAGGKDDVDFQDVLKNKGIVIVKLPRARFGDHASLVGSLLLGCVQNAALALSSEDECQNPASIYLDDFSAFIDKDMFQLVTGDTRRYGLGLICAARSLQDIPEDYRNLVLNNVGTLATFACAPKDAEALGKQMFRVDGRQAKQRTIANIFNAVNTTISNYDLIGDEEKLNVDRIIGQDDRTYFCYRVGSVAGVFNLRAPDFADAGRDVSESKLLSKAYKPYKEREGKKGN